MNISRQQPDINDRHEISRWTKQITRCEQCSQKLATAANRLVTVRLLSFIALLTLVLFPSDRQHYFGDFSLLLVIAALLLFVYLVRRHQTIKQRKKYFTYLRDYYHGALKRRKRQWSLISPPKLSNTKINTKHTDKDSFSDLAVNSESASLAKLFNMISDADAWQLWLQWLKTPSDDKTIATRQQAIKALSQKRPTILRFLQASAQHPVPLDSQQQVKQWLGDHDSGPALFGVLVISMISVVTFWAGIVGHLLYGWSMWLYISAGSINGVLTLMTLSTTNNLFQRCDGLKPIINRMQSRIAVIKNSPFKHDYLHALQHPLVDDNKAMASLTGIQRLAMLAELRHFGLFFLLAQLTLMWSIPVYIGIKKWHRQHRQKTIQANECLNELEVLFAIACFAAENREFSFPLQNSHQANIQLQALAHPLLTYQQRITNDLTWQKSKPMMLISGSNMAGKSTFMKAIGLNVLLSRLGAPVCAIQATWPQIQVKTVIKVEDSLADGDSYFMAELKRLVNIAKQPPNPSTHTMVTLCLFDEIMSGTNSHDRTEIFKAIIQRLKQQQAFAIFSTHDMKLADHAQSDAAFNLYQFSEQYRHDSDHHSSNTPAHYQMYFDYRLKPGICQQTNAQTLLQVLGLDC